jgi:hypothetical protein
MDKRRQGMNLNSFIEWQNGSPRSRCVDIRIHNDGEQQHIAIWVWDANLMEGQYVQAVSEIDLETAVSVKEKKQLAELRKKYETRTV